MAIKIDKSKCIGCGACEAICPDGFRLVDGKVMIKNQKAKCAKEAADSCPVQAIYVK